MRNKHTKNVQGVEVVFISDGEEIPVNWVSIGGALFNDLEVEFVLPKRFVLENPELANKMADKARKELLEMLSK